MSRSNRSDVTAFNGCKSIRSDLTAFGFGSESGGRPSEPTIFDTVEEWGIPLSESGNVLMYITGANKIVSIWNGSARIQANIYSKEKIDVTNINTITLSFKISAVYPSYYVGIFLNTVNTINDPVNMTYEAHDGTVGEWKTLTLDVSEVTGEYYFAVASIGATAEFKDLTFN